MEGIERSNLSGEQAVEELELATVNLNTGPPESFAPSPMGSSSVWQRKWVRIISGVFGSALGVICTVLVYQRLRSTPIEAAVVFSGVSVADMTFREKGPIGPFCPIAVSSRCYKLAPLVECIIESCLKNISHDWFAWAEFLSHDRCQATIGLQPFYGQYTPPICPTRYDCLRQCLPPEVLSGSM